MIFSRKRSHARRQRASTPPPPPREQYRDPIRASAVPEELIAARAYEKWQLRGCPMGQDSIQDWLAAKAELEGERLGWVAPEPGDRLRGL